MAATIDDDVEPADTPEVESVADDEVEADDDDVEIDPGLARPVD